MYRRFGVELPPGRVWVSVRCFAPDHRDRHKSARVNLDTGGFKCFGCLRQGGCLDALQLLGVDRDEARRVAVEYGILEPVSRSRPTPPGVRPAATSATVDPPTAAAELGGRVDYDNLPRGSQVTLDRVWIYTDGQGAPVGRVHRLDLVDGTKRVWQERPDGD